MVASVAQLSRLSNRVCLFRLTWWWLSAPCATATRASRPNTATDAPSPCPLPRVCSVAPKHPSMLRDRRLIVGPRFPRLQAEADCARGIAVAKLFWSQSFDDFTVDFHVVVALCLE